MFNSQDPECRVCEKKIVCEAQTNKNLYGSVYKNSSISQENSNEILVIRKRGRRKSANTVPIKKSNKGTSQHILNSCERLIFFLLNRENNGIPVSNIKSSESKQFIANIISATGVPCTVGTVSQISGFMKQLRMVEFYMQNHPEVIRNSGFPEF
jgi:hypothetical protein